MACIIQHVSRRSSDSYFAATLDGPAKLRGLFLENPPSSLVIMGAAMLGTGHGW